MLQSPAVDSSSKVPSTQADRWTLCNGDQTLCPSTLALVPKTSSKLRRAAERTAPQERKAPRQNHPQKNKTRKDTYSSSGPYYHTIDFNAVPPCSTVPCRARGRAAALPFRHHRVCRRVVFVFTVGGATRSAKGERGGGMNGASEAHMQW